MPKISQVQTAFTGGEFSPMLYGQIHTERYKAGMQVCLNYIPTLQGPLVRRPGTKYVVNVKSSGQPPALIPFIFSQTQSYALEFGSSYIRFYTNNGQVVTNSNVFQVSGSFNLPPSQSGTVSLSTINSLTFSATRLTLSPRATETVSGSAVLAPGVALELPSPFGGDTSRIKYAQQNDTLYLAHPNYPPYKLQRFGQYDWTIKPVVFQDGPYLPLNSYATLGDSTNVTLGPSIATLFPIIQTGSSRLIYSACGYTSTNEIALTTNAPHSYLTGQKVWVQGIQGTLEANNDYSNINSSVWTVYAPDTSTVVLRGTKFVNNLFHSTGTIQPAVFLLQTVNSSSPYYGFPQDAQRDCPRLIGLVDPTSGQRTWGVITSVINAAAASATLFSPAPSTSSCLVWQLGVYSIGNGFPGAVAFHQDRLGWAGAANTPQQIDLSQAGSYEQYAATGSNQQVTDANALQFHLLSQEANPVMWMKSAQQGLLAGSLNAEWVISPNTQAGGLTPTNVNAQATSYFGSADADAVMAGNASVYVQRAQRKVREMTYFFQVGTFRSTDLTEISEHISLPQITKLAVQKETLPLVWGVRSDGYLVSMSYSRDDVSLKAGWARHVLGGQSDSGGTNPVVKSICAIPATANSSSYEQLWMVVNRSTLSGSTYCAVEYTTKPYDDSFVQEDAFFGDCGATYDSPKFLSGLSTASSAIVSCSSHGFSNGDAVRIVKVIGLNSGAIDSYGNFSGGNLVNENTFTVGSALSHTFALLNFGSSAVNSLGYSAYVSGGEVRKMVLTISGLDWLNGETVGCLTDGGNHPDVLVQSGSVTLNYRAAKVQFGYRYNSDAQTLQDEGGSAQGTAVGETRRVHRVAFMLHNVGNFQTGAEFTDLTTLELSRANNQRADQATPLFSGVMRDGLGAPYDFNGDVCFRQNDMLPGMIQSLTMFYEVQDV